MTALYVGAGSPWPANVFLRGLPLKASEGATILIVDDDALVGEMYKLALSRAGLGVVVARDGIEGLRMAETGSPEMIFLDIRMPGMNGLEVLRQLGASAKTRDIPVVMLSNYDDHHYLTESIRLGAKEYLVKAGINPADLVAVVARWRRKSAT
jgi:CheY-like chemotaxis protein